MRAIRLGVSITAFVGLTLQVASAQRQPAGQWPHYAGDLAATHYSTLDQITAANVAQLKIAWEWMPGDKALPQYGTRPGAFQNTPLMIDGVLYVSTPYNVVAALDATTGKELWRYDPKVYEDGQPPNGQGFAHRGVAAWRDASAGGKLRIFLNARYRLIQLDAKTGQPVDGFGSHGVVDLSEGPGVGDQQEALHQHFAADRLQGSRHCRKRRRRSPHLQERSAWRRARLQRANGEGGVDLPYGSAAR